MCARAPTRTDSVNGTTSEGLSLSVDERCELQDEWAKVGREHDLQVIAQCGASALPDVQQLVEHAARCAS